MHSLSSPRRRLMALALGAAVFVLTIAGGPTPAAAATGPSPLAPYLLAAPNANYHSDPSAAAMVVRDLRKVIGASDPGLETAAVAWTGPAHILELVYTTSTPHMIFGPQNVSDVELATTAFCSDLRPIAVSLPSGQAEVCHDPANPATIVTWGTSAYVASVMSNLSPAATVAMAQQQATQLDAASSTAGAPAIPAGLVPFLVILLILAILNLAGAWRLFTKAGRPGWRVIVPVYNAMTMAEIGGLAPRIGVAVSALGIISSGITHVVPPNSPAIAFATPVAAAGYVLGAYMLAYVARMFSLSNRAAVLCAIFPFIGIPWIGLGPHLYSGAATPITGGGRTRNAPGGLAPMTGPARSPWGPNAGATSPSSSPWGGTPSPSVSSPTSSPWAAAPAPGASPDPGAAWPSASPSPAASPWPSASPSPAPAPWPAAAPSPAAPPSGPALDVGWHPIDGDQTHLAYWDGSGFISRRRWDGTQWQED